jgi:acetyltransferase-like isoleucine patch superfamily enzyme
VSGRIHLDHDWYGTGLPQNVKLDDNVWIDTSYGFDQCSSELQPGIILGTAAGAYDRTSFIVGRQGQVSVGAYTILNSACLIANERIEIGSHCLIAWGTVLTDTWWGLRGSTAEARRRVLAAAASDPLRRMLPIAAPQPVILEDNSWVGFDVVILPGTRLGRGSVVGSKTVVDGNVPPYAVVVGNPARIVRYLSADDTDEVRQRALQDCRR